MSGPLMQLVATALVTSFILCCVLSGLLQVLAWFRHTRDGAPVSLRALRHPEAYFDPVGQRQILLSRRLLSIGIFAYLTYGVLLVLSSVFRAG